MKTRCLIATMDDDVLYRRTISLIYIYIYIWASFPNCKSRGLQLSLSCEPCGECIKIVSSLLSIVQQGSSWTRKGHVSDLEQNYSLRDGTSKFFASEYPQ